MVIVSPILERETIFNGEIIWNTAGILIIGSKILINIKRFKSFKKLLFQTAATLLA